LLILNNVFPQKYWTSHESYICIPTQSTGFKYNKNTDKWESVNFNVEGKKYYVQKIKDEGYRWSEFGTDRKTFCPNSIFTKDFGSLSCKLYDGSLELHMDTLRFVQTYNMGYFDGNTINPLTPNIQIGTCLPTD
jgi:hypothetical protein